VGGNVDIAVKTDHLRLGDNTIYAISYYLQNGMRQDEKQTPITHVTLVQSVTITEPNENDVFLHGSKVTFKAQMTPPLAVDSWSWQIVEGEGSPGTSIADTYEPVLKNAANAYDTPAIFKAKVTARADGQSYSAELQVKVVYPKIDIIDFKSTKPVIHEGDWVPHDPEWKSTMTDESVSVFTRKTRIKADATFKTALPLTNPTEINRLYANVAWWVKGDCDLQSNPSAQTISGDSTVVTVEGTSELSNEIYAYDGTWQWWRKLKYEWSYRMPGTGETDHNIAPRPNDNLHTLYETLADPVQGIPVYETLLHITCNAARGKTTVADALSGIWGEFTDRDVRRKYGANRQMTYYRSYRCQSTTTLALMMGLDGQCGAWAKMFLDMLKHHGIHPPHAYYYFGPAAEDVILVKKWAFSGSGTSGDALLPYLGVVPSAGAMLDWTTFRGDTRYNWIYGKEVSDQNGVPGQGIKNPASFFGNHQLVIIDGSLYDPSYGRLYRSETELDDTSLAGFCTLSPGIVNETVLGVDVNGNHNATDTAVPALKALMRNNPAGLNIQRDNNVTEY